MNAFSEVTACPKNAVVEVFVPEEVTSIRKEPGVVHFTIVKQRDVLPVHLYIGHNARLRDFRGRTIMCAASSKMVTRRHGCLANVLKLVPVDEGVAPNAMLKRVCRGEFRVQPL
jgi:hypothetical protein